ncbi:hypothetical protein DENIS_3878 [Desulfonema ishimotonii]|uniref:Fibronectin type-III domain-containing protein n=1 Tax=Desulfonema ishimotonii TaxID=45657 RepID=A0A401G0Y5_9BACT|nr:RHS repeat-associated core domain-containing protein [Desulfonema ishimotonii]GBC62894.1 hypothetical protein DENIS_3878 [Desulfonema ishimotonii]
MKRFLILLVLTLTAIWLPAAESISGSFDAGDLELTNVNIDDNGDIVPGAGSPVTDPEKIVIPFAQEVRAGFVYEGAGYVSDFGWMRYEDAVDADGNFRGWNNISVDKKHVLFVKIRDDAEGSGCCNGGNGILDTDYGENGNFPASDETALAGFDDGSGVPFVTDGDGAVTPKDMEKSLGTLPGGTEVVFFLTANQRYTTTDTDAVYFSKTAWNTDSYTGCTPPAGDSLWTDEAAGIFDKEYDLGAFLDVADEGTCRVRSEWLTESAQDRLNTYFGITLSGTYPLRIREDVAGKFPHVILATSDTDADQRVLGWEDTRSGGDADHNDMVFRIGYRGGCGGTVCLKNGAAVTPSAPNAVYTGVTLEVADHIPSADGNIRYYVSATGGDSWTEVVSWDSVTQSDGDGETVSNWTPGTPPHTRRTVHLTGIPEGRVLIWKAELSAPDSTQVPRLSEVTVSGDTGSLSEMLNSAIGIWLMEEGEGTTVADSSGNGNDAVLGHNSDSAGPVWESDVQQGNNIRFSTEARWNSRYGNYADLGALDISSGGDRLTVGCMFRADPDQGDALLFSTRQNGNERYLNLTARSDGSFYFMIRTPDGEAACRTAAGKFQPGEWTFVVAMYDGQTMRIYADGREIFAEGGYSGGPEYAPGVHTHISALQEGNALYPFFDGNISYAFIYGRTLSATEIGFIYQNGKAAFHSGTPDETPPTVPSNLTATAVSASQTDLAWEASSDDTGVAGYKIFRDDAEIGTTAGTAYSDTGLSAETAYVYKIRAYDSAGNLSDFSPAVSVTTPAEAVLITFVADPTEIAAGASSTLSWTVENADTVTIDNGIGAVNVSGTQAVSPTETTTYTLTATGPGGTQTASVTVTVTADQPAPGITFSADPTEIAAGASATLSWTVENADTVTIDNGIGTVSVSGTQAVFPAETTTYTLTATGPGGTATASVTIQVNGTSDLPSVTFTASPVSIAKGGTATLSWSSINAQKAYIDNGIGMVEISGTTDVTPAHTTTYTITVSGDTGVASAQAAITVLGNPETLPEGSFGEKYRDLIPSDATIEEYDSDRFSIITGKVKGADGVRISDVSVTILNHPEYGTVLTDEEGRFSVPVEGGSHMTAVFRKSGLISAQRKVYVPWNDIAITETVRMIPEDPVATTVTFDGSADTVISHRSTEVTDEFGSRSCTVVFTGDNEAYLQDENGENLTDHPLETITVRATEYDTQESMPAVLPPNSAYTYCVELAADGVDRIGFKKPVTVWVDNFLGFEVGTAVPVGTYNRDRGVWEPLDNGIVVRLLDSDGDGVTDAYDEDGDGVSDGQVRGLDDPTVYPPYGPDASDSGESTFLKVELSHFTPYDFNWSYRLESDADDPNPESGPDADEQKEEPLTCPTKNIASSVEDRSRIFHEDIPVPGTAFSLHYVSNRVRGYQHFITVPASGDSVPESLEGIVVNVRIAGRSFQKELPALPNQKAEFIWDGTDYLGNEVFGKFKADVEIGFKYKAYYSVSEAFKRAFGQTGEILVEKLARQAGIRWKKHILTINRAEGNLVAQGWDISTHHRYYPAGEQTLFKGDGSTFTKYNIIETVAGTGEKGFNGDNIEATKAQLYFPNYIYVDSEGNLYIADWYNYRVRKVDVNGTITTVAGTGEYGFNGDGIKATEANLAYPIGLTMDTSGNLYIMDGFNYRIRKVDSDGYISTVVGNGQKGSYGEEIPATQAKVDFDCEGAIVVDSAGNLYFSDVDFSNTGIQRIRKVDTKGIITTVAGGGTNNEDGILATEAVLSFPSGFAVDDSGNLYVAEHYYPKIRKIDPSGIITTVAGNGVFTKEPGVGDGGPATEARFGNIYDIALDTSGNLYVTDYYHHCIRKIDTKGYISTVAGNGTEGYMGDGGPATQAQLNCPYGIATDDAGNLWFAEQVNNRIRKIYTPPLSVASMEPDDILFVEDNGMGHIMYPDGRHRKTVETDTGTPVYEFAYDSDNNLRTITDRFGRDTLISGYGTGTITITSPDGLETRLKIDTAHNQLTHIIYPGHTESDCYRFEYADNDGLLTLKTEPAGNRFHHEFDERGRLVEAWDEDESGNKYGSWTFNRTIGTDGFIYSTVTTALDNQTVYKDLTDSTGKYTSEITGPAGGMTYFEQSADSLKVRKEQPCGMAYDLEYDFDSEYKFRYLKKVSESTEAGLTRVVEKNRTYEETDGDSANGPDIITDTVTVNGNPTTVVKDIRQSRITATSPEGRTVTTLYDPDTLLTEKVSIPGLNDTTYAYYDDGRLRQVVTGTREYSLTYDSSGNLATAVTPDNRTTRFDEYDPVGRLKKVTRPDNSVVRFEYDANGNMTALFKPGTSGEVEHGFGSDKVNLPESYTPPADGSGYVWQYDKDRRLIREEFPSGGQIVYDHTDPNDETDKSRLWEIRPSDGTDTVVYDYYDCGTKVASVTKGSESVTYGYNGSLVTSEALAGTLEQTLGYHYNNDLAVSSFTYAGETESYTYDNDGLLTGAGDFTITRKEQNGLPESVSDSALTLSRDFSGYGETDREAYSVGGDQMVWEITSRDNAGRIRQKTETVGGETITYDYDYDEMGRLLTVKKDGTPVEEYRYDAAGRRNYELNTRRGISRTADGDFDYDDADCLTGIGDADYEYDEDGFLLRKTDGADVTLYDYSLRGELLSVSLPDGRFIEYVHDPLGRRIAKKIDGTITEKYLWSGLTTLMAVYNGGDNLLMRFEYAAGRMPVAMTKGGQRYYLAYDQVGTLRVVTDASGNPVKQVGYDTFGNVISDTDFAVPFGFAGGLYDADTGLIRFGHRDYDPDAGRWTAKDPIGFAGGDTDLYGYCLGDPVNGIDPDGRFVFAAAFAFGAISSYGGLTMLGDAAVAFAIGQIITQMSKGDGNLPDISILGDAVKASSPCPSPNNSDDDGKEDRYLDKDELKALKKKIKKDGYKNVEELKTPHGKNAGKYDLYVKPDGNIVVKPKGGAGIGEPTGYNIYNL